MDAGRLKNSFKVIQLVVKVSLMIILKIVGSVVSQDPGWQSFASALASRKGALAGS